MHAVSGRCQICDEAVQQDLIPLQRPQGVLMLAIGPPWLWLWGRLEKAWLGGYNRSKLDQPVRGGEGFQTCAASGVGGGMGGGLRYPTLALPVWWLTCCGFWGLRWEGGVGG